MRVFPFKYRRNKKFLFQRELSLASTIASLENLAVPIFTKREVKDKDEGK